MVIKGETANAKVLKQRLRTNIKGTRLIQKFYFIWQLSKASKNKELQVGCIVHEIEINLKQLIQEIPVTKFFKHRSQYMIYLLPLTLT